MMSRKVTARPHSNGTATASATAGPITSSPVTARPTMRPARLGLGGGAGSGGGGGGAGAGGRAAAARRRVYAVLSISVVMNPPWSAPVVQSSVLRPGSWEAHTIATLATDF